MAKTKDNDYFEMLKEMARISCRAAEMLKSILADFRQDRLAEDMRRLHAVENEGDDRRHMLVDKLAKEFITPIDREDILLITNSIDDVTDAVEDVLLKVYMFNIRGIQPDAIEFTDIINNCCQKLYNVFEEFGDLKKSKILHTLIVDLNQLEEQGDALYIESVRRLYVGGSDAIETAAWTEIFGCMELICDACETVADLVEHVVMKNT